MNNKQRRKALITRPREDAAALATALNLRGIPSVIAPMMQTEFLSEDIESDLVSAQAVLFTSRNGVRAFVRVSDRRDQQIYAVGDSTATLAIENGFTNVKSANGDSKDLATLVKDRLRPQDGPLIHISGKTVAGDLSGILSVAGFQVARQALYQAKPISALSADVVAAIRNGEIKYVLFFSPRTARIFSDLFESADLTEHCRDIEAICLSKAIRAELQRKYWKEQRTATEPTMESLLKIIDSVSGYAETNVNANLEHDSKPVDLAPLQQAMERALARADSPPSTSVDLSGNEEEVVQEPALNPQTPSVDRQPPSDHDGVPTLESPMTTAPNLDKSSSTKKDVDPIASSARSNMAVFTWSLVTVLVVIVSGYFTLPLWRGMLPQHIQKTLAGGKIADTSSNERLFNELASLRSQNAALEATVANLGKNLDASRAQLSAIAEIEARQNNSEKRLENFRAEIEAAGREKKPNVDPGLYKRLEELEKIVSVSAEFDSQQLASNQKVRAGIDALTLRLKSLETAIAEIGDLSKAIGQADTLVLAAGQLSDALTRSGPFVAELATLKNVSGNNAEIVALIKPIAELAGQGIPSQAALIFRFTSLVDAMVSATSIVNGDDWIQRTKSRLQGFINVRRVDGKGNGPDAIIARAERAAERGDLELIVSEISKLSGPAAATAKLWLKDARARLITEEVRSALKRVVLERLAAPR
ncbi:MAG: uroporphyrinogen-III synthase [Pseudomonadota bacterium]|nr:uroporphyrinogen-III synthase [Pseudomonadota bacterium]